MDFFGFLWISICLVVSGPCFDNPTVEEDIDQMFGDLAKWVRKTLHFAQTIAEFYNSLKLFLQRLRRPHEPHREVLVVDKVRDWKSYFETINKQVKGISGPTAPRMFKMELRSSCLARFRITMCLYT
jgi:hypothetical protein